ncbi:MAG: carboxymuconolactone decarboxylase family protein, partial [Sporomusa sp.]
EIVRLKLSGRTDVAPPSGYQVFAPVIDDFLKEHLFADIFCRDNLDYLSREIATVAALASITGTNSQLQFHMGAAMNVGLTEAQMRDLISVLGSSLGRVQSNNAAEVFRQVLSGRAR